MIIKLAELNTAIPNHFFLSSSILPFSFSPGPLSFLFAAIYSVVFVVADRLPFRVHHLLSGAKGGARGRRATQELANEEALCISALTFPKATVHIVLGRR